MEDEPFDPRLLPGLPQGHLLPPPLTGVGVPARLQPAIELAVMEEEDAVRFGGDHDGAAREVTLPDGPIEGVGVAAHKVEDAAEMGRLLGIGGHMPGQDLG
jgi:hypothetical protein